MREKRVSREATIHFHSDHFAGHTTVPCEIEFHDPPPAAATGESPVRIFLARHAAQAPTYRPPREKPAPDLHEAAHRLADAVGEIVRLSKLGNADEIADKVHAAVRKAVGEKEG